VWVLRPQTPFYGFQKGLASEFKIKRKGVAENASDSTYRIARNGPKCIDNDSYLRNKPGKFLSIARERGTTRITHDHDCDSEKI